MIQFGYCLPIFAWHLAGLFRTPAYERLDTTTTMRLGVLADQIGYHSLWVADHLMLGEDEAILEGWTTLAALAGMTQRAKLGIIHYNNAFRNPSLTAKMTATFDQISRGRYIHFIDFGNQPREFLAYGLHEDDTREARVAQMCEGLELTLALWTSAQPVNFDGRFVRARNAVCEPKPVQKPHPPIWMGEAWPEMLDATARYADAWNTTPVSITQLRERLALLRAACQRTGRDPDSIEKTLEIQVLIGEDSADVRAKLRRMLALLPSHQTPTDELMRYANDSSDEMPDFIREGWLAGTPDEVAQRVQAYIDEGITHFMLWIVDAPDESGMRLFAQRVMPRFASGESGG